MTLLALLLVALAPQSRATPGALADEMWDSGSDAVSLLQFHMRKVGTQNASQAVTDVVNVNAPDMLESALGMANATGRPLAEALHALSGLAATVTPTEAVHNGELITSSDIARLTGENSMNHGCSGDLCYQGDMQAAAPAELLLFQHLGDRAGGRGNRSSGAKWVAAGAPWTGAVVKYCFASDMDAENQQLFQLAVSQIENAVSCLSFENVGNSGGHASASSDTSKQCDAAPAIFVQSRADQGCWSYVGMQGSPFSALIGGEVLELRAQLLNLRPVGCAVLGIVVHELGHALGMAHEQSRPDRDQYVTVHWDNIPEDKANNFDIDAGGYTAHSYDYLSVMHYGVDDFSDTGGATLTTKDGLHDNQIGQRVGLAQYDVDQLADMYREVVATCAANQIDANQGCQDKDAAHCSALAACATAQDMDKCCGCGGGLTHQCYTGSDCHRPAALPVLDHAACVLDRTADWNGQYACVTQHQCDYTVRVRCESAPGRYWDYAPSGCCQLPPWGGAVCAGAGCSFERP